MRQYLDLVHDILAGGSHRPNRTGVDTVASFSQHYEVDLGDGYPLLTTKRMDGYRWNSMIHEVCWYLSGEEHIRNLREETKIWDAWADDAGHLDTAYGRFWRRFPIPEQADRLPGESWPADAHRWVNTEEGTFDQLAYVVDTLEEQPNSRRLVVSAWHPANAAVSTLPPCHYTFVFNAQGGRLNCHLTQRSADVALGVPFNIAAYALLTTAVANQVDLEPGIFGHTLVDAHVYCGTGPRGEWYSDNLPTLQERLAAVSDPSDYRAVREWLLETVPPESEDSSGLDHVPGLLTQLSREPLSRPSLQVADVTLDALTYEDVSLEDYESHGPLEFAVAE